MLYKRIRDLREDHDLTQTQIAKYLHITQRTYSRYETGHSAIPIEIFSQLADYYHTTIDYLANRTNKK
ncbi:helix-turn-helix domain-containing protein [Massiliimalia timonensis]|uniref:helix-turn-helix domain-containing protein n=1 Tax=Massiliimalia timonensis TaxID=1987501 RepID=UPI00189FA220|nr:helix-turn-helix transcriptional regulator [Massiliimalia timonensis]